jgi:hypothetical protein
VNNINPVDRHAEFNKHSQRRMREEFSKIHEIALRWGDEFRDDGAPPIPQSVSGKISDGLSMGGSQAGCPTPAAADDVTIFGVCVSKLSPLKRIVIQVEYAECRGWPIREKIRHLLRHHKIRMSTTSWDKNLSGAREILLVAFEILFDRTI